MQGGVGDDVYRVDSAGDVVIEAAGAGNDMVVTTFSYVLGANLERLHFEGTAAVTGAGNALNNAITGNHAANSLFGVDGDDTLAGRGGADTLNGGNGSDWAQYTFATAGVTASLASSASNTGEAAGDVYISIENIRGSVHDDTLQGNTTANFLLGDDGNDTLIGGAGVDTLDGGAGADLYIFGRGDGHDQITAPASDGSADKLAFGSGVNSEQLWFSQDGDDLIISIIGTNDSMTVKGWYATGNDQLDRIEVADGDFLLANDVDALVTAMASVTQPPLGQTSLTAQQQQQLAPTLAASWHQAA